MIRVTVEGVCKRYGQVEALRDVTLEFEPGRLSAILGPSGGGKTTLLRSIAGFVPVEPGVTPRTGPANGASLRTGTVEIRPVIEIPGLPTE